jgi:pimeloyl-ACP methyl ester carboxylesterase
MADLNRTIDRSIKISKTVSSLVDKRVRVAQQRFAKRTGEAAKGLSTPQASLKTPYEVWRQGAEYQLDFVQRSVLYWDTMRQRGNQWLVHEAAGKPPVLAYKYETLADARTFERPASYALVRIIPPKGVKVDDDKRPFVIVDPRAGHGPGIGGFKEDSEVGVALSAGHPVYFVIFFPEPMPGQTLADVTDAEAEFIRIVAERHPQSEKPAIIGNCQGGWAVMMLAAARPDIAGPLVINGAPMSYWSGSDGDSPMRYSGGLLGGAWLSLLASDLGGGKFDGAHLVANFERLNPANSLWEKWYHIFSNIDTEAERFLEFERWWGGFYLFNEEEMRWIVNNLFVGNKLSAGEARLGPGRHFDLKSIRQPIIVFASMGDNITPPQQAFNWITDVYSSTEEIKANGQTIVGLLHEDIGHLGIFVSGKVAKKEHAQIVEVLKYIQQLPPGLYGMSIEEHHNPAGETTYDVTLRERKVEDLRSLQTYDRVDEKPFEAVAALSELLERAYSLLVRPFVRAATPEWLAKASRDLHPLRAQYWMLSDKNPMLWALPYVADVVRAQRKPRAADNGLLAVEQYASAFTSAALDWYRDLRDASAEGAFFQVYGNMLSLQMADEREEMRKKIKFDPRTLPAVRQVLDTIEEGSALEGYTRMAMLISKAGGGTHSLAQMARARELLAATRELARLSEDDRRRLLQEETIVVEFEPLRAKRSLPKLLRSASERRHAHMLLDQIESTHTLEDRQRTVLAELRSLLPLASRVGATIEAGPAPRRLTVTRKMVAAPRKPAAGARKSAAVQRKPVASTVKSAANKRKPVAAKRKLR